MGETDGMKKNRNQMTASLLIITTIIAFVIFFGLTAAYLALYEWLKGFGLGFWQIVTLWTAIVVAAGIIASWNRFWDDQGSA